MRPNSPTTYYNPVDAGIVYMYLENYPDLMHQIAVELGYHNPPLGVNLESAPSEAEWFERLMEQMWIADQPGGKKSGARDARIWLKSSPHTVRTTADLVELIQHRKKEREEAGIRG